MAKIMVFLMVWIIAGCQKDETADTLFWIDLQIPSLIANNPNRYEHFLERVQALKIKALQANGVRKEYSFAAGTWDRIELAGLQLSETENPTIELEASIWDTDAAGFPRGYPSFSGKKKIQWDEVSSGSRVEIPMKLEISVKNYD